LSEFSAFSRKLPWPIAPGLVKGYTASHLTSHSGNELTSVSILSSSFQAIGEIKNLDLSALLNYTEQRYFFCPYIPYCLFLLSLFIDLAHVCFFLFGVKQKIPVISKMRFNFVKTESLGLRKTSFKYCELSLNLWMKFVHFSWHE